jgi:hypothetical protein
LKIGIAATPLVLIVLAGFFVAAPMDMWQDSSSSADSSHSAIVEGSLSREQYVAAKVRVWRQFIKARKSCDGLADSDRDRCLQQARDERAAGISVVNASYSGAKAD